MRRLRPAALRLAVLGLLVGAAPADAQGWLPWFGLGGPGWGDAAPTDRPASAQPRRHRAWRLRYATWMPLPRRQRRPDATTDAPDRRVRHLHRAIPVGLRVDPIPRLRATVPASPRPTTLHAEPAVEIDPVHATPIPTVLPVAPRAAPDVPVAPLD